MKASPKGSITADPLDLSCFPAERAKCREKFITEYLITALSTWLGLSGIGACRGWVG